MLLAGLSRSRRAQYDKLVSIEMIEAVGADFLDDLLRASARRLLKPEGSMLLQAITIQDQYYERALKSVDYIQRYIFPGSFIPSVDGDLAIGAHGHRLQDVSSRRHRPALRAHAARVARAVLPQPRAAVRKLGLSDSFVRLWEYYLCYCEGGFMERAARHRADAADEAGVSRSPLAGGA